MSASSGVYVPPHLRNRPSQPVAGPSRVSAQSTSSRYTSDSSSSNPSRPWLSRSHNDPSTSTIAPQSSEPYDARRPYRPPTGSASSPSRQPRDGSQGRSGGGYSGPPTLYVFGDSFTGPLKLISEESVKVTTFKGASAKGLNNPNSIKQVSRDLLPSLNTIMAPPPYVYTPSTGRWALLIFGNVDLQINYLWQLQHKPITPASFPASTATEVDTTDELPHAFGPNVLASATETSMTGPALGPDLFVERVVQGYTAWLEREVVNGPIGERIRGRAEDTSSIRRKAPGKVLIAAALPPLVEDETLHRIPEKYVERLEEDHAKTQRALEREDRLGRIGPSGEDEKSSRTPWARSRSNSSSSNDAPVVDDVRPSTPKSADSSTSSSHCPSRLASSSHTNITSPASSEANRKAVDPAAGPSDRKTIQSLLQHEPALCDLTTRIRMTDKYNALLKTFCDAHRDVLGFVDIIPSIVAGNSADNAETTLPGQADRATWACPVDPTNIHPLWEPTLPLWLEEIGKHGVPTQSYSITTDAEETFKAYEADKRRRTANGPNDRIKIRDE